MGTKQLGFMFRLATILSIIAIITLFIVDVYTAEFYITVFSVVIAVAISVTSGIMFYKKAKKENQSVMEETKQIDKQTNQNTEEKNEKK